ncbi:unnamed protein product [Caenorhabditis auriculariae]|uniref:Protein phosphatase methylesterase 1 n=1 Tax=Caenorhabditis auriculariae TaxID=2777116 RepID=A0A8S1HAT4_9PELO|nr:unnamed protein product [Caenorhabditis auriculariae]
MSEMEEEDFVPPLPTQHEPTTSAKPLLQSVLSRNLPPKHGNPGKSTMATNTLTPLLWNQFFDEKRELHIGEDVFTVYLKGSRGPIFYLLHGGGYSGLTWACFAKSLCDQIECRIVAPDLRGHGASHSEDEEDLSVSRQVRDIADIFDKLFEKDQGDVSVCVIGHSMGGALAVHVVHEKVLKANVVGLIVIDVVEGTAMESLSGMVHFLNSRPPTFSSYENAIKFCLKSAMTRNSTAARISMPSQLREITENQLTWRIDLAKTEPHWRGWFEGLSSKFLDCSPPKLLALAGVDRFDRDLTIAQMQGKFQTCLLPKVGHCVQEDSPENLADEIARFAVRFRFATSKVGMVPSVFPERRPF